MATMTATEFAAALCGYIADFLGGDLTEEAFTEAVEELWSAQTLTTDGLSLRVSELVETIKGRLLFGPNSTVPSAATVNLGSLATHLVNVTGTIGISSFGSSARVENPVYVITAPAGFVLNHSANLITPTGAGITIPPGGSFAAKYEGAGVWRILWFGGAPGSNGASAREAAIAAGAIPPGSTDEEFIEYLREPVDTAVADFEASLGADPIDVSGDFTLLDSHNGKTIRFKGATAQLCTITGLSVGKGVEVVWAKGVGGVTFDEEDANSGHSAIAAVGGRVWVLHEPGLDGGASFFTLDGDTSL